MAVPLRVTMKEWVSTEETYKSIKMEDQCGRWRVELIGYFIPVLNDIFIPLAITSLQ